MKAPQQDHPFSRVWSTVKKIPRGKVATYGSVSRMVAHRLTPIGVAWALRAAREGAVPWHRVVNARGALSTKGKAKREQRELLIDEGITFARDGCVDLERFGWRRAL